jgi:hypothetical protein
MKHPIHFTGIHFIRKIVFLIAVLVLISTAIKSQERKIEKTMNLYITNDPVNKNITITFRAEKEILNVLVLVYDQTGNTIFLDNKYHFRGDYKGLVDIKHLPEGDYTVSIINDDEKFNKKLITQHELK